MTIFTTAREGYVFRSVYQSFCPQVRGRGFCIQGGVCLQWGVCLQAGLYSGGGLSIGGDLHRGLHPGGICPTPILTSSGSHCSIRYASHWNAFLFDSAKSQQWNPGNAKKKSTKKVRLGIDRWDVRGVRQLHTSLMVCSHCPIPTQTQTPIKNGL